MKITILMLSVCVASGQNLLENSSFECGNLRGFGYAAYGKAQWIPLTYDSVTVQHGTKAYRAEFDNTTNATLLTSRLYRLEPNTTYTVTYFAKADPSNVSGNSVDFAVLNSRGLETFSFNIFITTSWARYTNSFTTTNAEGKTTYYLQFGPHFGNGSALVHPGEWIHFDSLQLEKGAATTYAPMTPVEIGGDIDTAHAGHVYYDTDSPAIRVLGYNNTANSSNVVVKWTLYDYFNSLKASGSQTISVPANSGSTNTIAMPSVGYGSFRCIFWSDGIHDSLNEATYGVVRQPVSLANRTNSTFGTDVLDSDWSLGSAQRLGIHWNRHLSVNQYGRWNQAEPTSNNYVYYTNNVARNRTYDIEPLINIGAANFGSGARAAAPDIPDYATNSTDYWPDNTQLSNFIFNVVGAYKPYVQYWEIFNEISNTNQYTNVLKFAKGAATAADANRILVAPADFYWVNAAGELTILGDSAFDVWSTHIYPDVGDYISATNTSALMASHSNKPGWNTESGLRSDSFYATSLWEETLDQAVSPTDNLGWTRRYIDRNTSTLDNFFNSQQGNIRKYFYYEMRTTGGFEGLISYSMMDFNNTVKPSGTFYSALINFVDGGVPGGRFSVNGQTNAWWWLRNNQCVVCMLPNDFLNTSTPSSKLLLTTTLPAIQFNCYDIVGNSVAYSSGVKFGRNPVYLVGASGVDTNTVVTSLSVSASTDTQAPNLSIVTWPTVASGVPSRFTWRWTAIDDCSLETWWTNITSAIQYSYKLTPGDSAFSAWTNVDWATYTNLDGNTAYTFQVAAKDAAGNTVTNSVSTSLQPATVANVGRITAAQ